MKDGAKILRFPGTWQGRSDSGNDGVGFEVWDDSEGILKSEDYAGLVGYCKREVSGDNE